MKMKMRCCLLATSVLLASCNQTQEEVAVISQSFVHKYGYAVSKNEWLSHNYPGQVITTMRDGSTIIETYEDGELHGAKTMTYPHSQTLSLYELYNHGELVKVVSYDEKGLPVEEKNYLSPMRVAVTQWYPDGAPMMVEELASGELLEGQYFNPQNETESRVIKGHGVRVERNRQGVLVAKDEMQAGSVIRKDSYYPSGAILSSATYQNGKLHGQRCQFEPSGEPLSIEEYVNGNLHGLAVYFKNGAKTLEISYMNGMKNGYETHFLDGKEISQRISWEDNKLHGPTYYYIDGAAHTEWYYENKHVSAKKYEELYQLDMMISQISNNLQDSPMR